jgi:hypothetical protein
VTLKLELPFYDPEVLERCLRAFAPIGNEIPAEALRDVRLCEALNAALRLTIESQNDPRPEPNIC